MAEPVGDTIGGYLVEGILGVGGMGAVYRARHPRLPRSDALKVLGGGYSSDPVYRARFEREADRAAALDHPSIVTVYDRGEDAGRLWMSMQLVPGTDAFGLIRERPGGLPLAQVVDIVTAIGSALDHAHAAGVLHRDIKPGNIFVDRSTPTLRYLLGDFGIARGNTDAALTEVGSVVGTVDYCSPEQLTGEPIGPASDQYALAATAVYLLTGCRPFGTASADTIAKNHFSAPPPQPSSIRPELPRQVDVVLGRAMAKTPGQRYPDNGALAAALASCLPSRIPAPSTPAALTALPPQPAPRPAPTPQPPAATPQRPMAAALTDSVTAPTRRWAAPAAAPGAVPANRSPRTLFHKAAAAAVVGVVTMLALVLYLQGRQPPTPTAAPSSSSTTILDARGTIDPCLIPPDVLRRVGLGPLSAGTAPQPLWDCFATVLGTPGLTVEFVHYPATSDEPLGVAARTVYQTQGRELDGLPGWRSYVTAAESSTTPTYCNVAFLGPDGAGLLEIYTLLAPAGHGASAGDVDARRELCDRLPELATAVAPLLAAS